MDAETPSNAFLQAILLNDTLYFMGGNYSFRNSNDNDRNRPKDQLYSLNLRSTFPVNDSLSDNSIHSTASSDTQWVAGGVFFTDTQATTLYSFAGYHDGLTSQEDNTLASYDIAKDSWSRAPLSGVSLHKYDGGQAMFATARSGGSALGFIAGGIDAPSSMLTCDASDPKNLGCKNTTSGVPYFWGPATEYIRFGEKGVLISVGGYTAPGNKQQRDMSAVQVYDIASEEWFEVKAGGDIPKSRSSFCSGLSSAPDDSSFQMTVYGGYYGPQGGDIGADPRADVYVLTMPAFRWIKIIDDGTHTGVSSGLGQRRHLCNVYQDRQMFVLGGDYIDGNKDGNGTDPIDGSQCNAKYPALKLLDTTTYEWQSQFPVPDAAYKVPKKVYDVIGGGPDGGARMTAPSDGFNGSAASIFSKRVTRLESSNSPANQNAADASQNSSSSSSSNTGAIAGGVVGGVAAIAIISLIIWFLLRRRRRRNATQPNQELYKSELPAEQKEPFMSNDKPAGYKTLELRGDDPEGLKAGKSYGMSPRELDGVQPPGYDTPQELSGTSVAR